VGQLLDGQPFDYPGRAEVEAEGGGRANPANRTWLLPHVVGPHRQLPEAHVFEDIMQLVDWVREGTPSIVTAEHARHVVDIIESAYRAAEMGQTQALGTTF
jgi:predicted dehydrogenase